MRFPSRNSPVTTGLRQASSAKMFSAKKGLMSGLRLTSVVGSGWKTVPGETARDVANRFRELNRKLDTWQILRRTLHEGHAKNTATAASAAYGAAAENAQHVNRALS